MRKYFLVVCLLWLGMSLQAQHVLKVEITGIKKVRGTVNLCLVTKPSEFLSSCGNTADISVTGKALLFVKEDLKPGKYAISMYHDANGNGKLDSNFLGIPKERYGFSNNARGSFGPPDYEECIFEVKGDTTIAIRLK